jgi:signal transduction histidine kinase
VKWVSVDLSAVAREVAAALHRKYGRELDIQVQSDLLVFGDIDLLRILMTEILDNSIKFTPNDRVPSVQVGKKEDSIFITDNAIGFAPEHSEKIYKPFEKLNGVDESPGSGIGLSMVKIIANRLEGRVWSESECEKGTTFWLSLGKPETQN